MPLVAAARSIDALKKLRESQEARGSLDA